MTRQRSAASVIVRIGLQLLRPIVRTLGYRRTHMKRTLLALLLFMMSCEESTTGPMGATVKPKQPGLDGRPVLWIEPASRDSSGPTNTATDALLAEIVKNTASAPNEIATLREHLTTGNVRVRSAVVDALQSGSGREAKTGLLAAAADRHPAVSALALDALLQLSLNERDALFTQAMTSQDPVAALGAARYWRNLVLDPNSSPTSARLAQAMADCPHPAARMQLLPCDRINTRPIAAALEGDRVALAAREGCALLRAKSNGLVQAIPELIFALSHSNRWVRTLAARAIARGASGLSSDAHSLVKSTLQHASNTIEPTVAVAVAWALAAIGDDQGFATLAIYLRAGEDTVRIDALNSLLALTPAPKVLRRPDMYPALRKASTDDDVDVRQRVASVAGCLDDGRAVSLLAQLSSDRAPEVRAATALAFGRSGQLDAASPYLIDMVTSDVDRDTLDAAFMSLEHLVHGHEMRPLRDIDKFLESETSSERPFFGRDPLRWRRWFQTRGG